MKPMTDEQIATALFSARHLDPKAGPNDADGYDGSYHRAWFDCDVMDLRDDIILLGGGAGDGFYAYPINITKLRDALGIPHVEARNEAK